MHSSCEWCHLSGPVWRVPPCIRIEMYEYYLNNADFIPLLYCAVGLMMLLVKTPSENFVEFYKTESTMLYIVEKSYFYIEQL